MKATFSILFKYMEKRKNERKEEKKKKGGGIES